MEVREPSAKYLRKAAFKQTEVGTIPEDWDVKRISDFASVGSGGTPSREIASYWGGDIPWITTSQIDFGTIVEAEQYITQDGLNNSAAKLLPAGTLLMALYGQGKTRGKVGVLGLPAATNQACAFIALHGNVSKEFILHFLASRYEAIRNSSNTGSQENLNGNIVKGTLVAFPSLSEQQAIATALSDADALIESLEQLLAKKRQIKQGAMQELLTGKRRLPGFGPSFKYKKTDLGFVPEDWDVISLGDIAQCLIGLTYSPNDVREFGTLVLRSSNIQDGHLSYEDNVYVDMSLPPRVITQTGDILVCVRNGSRQLIGKCARIEESASGSAFGAFMAVLRCKSHEFLFQQFQSNILKRQINDGMGATINQITNKDMAAFKVIWPALEEEQAAIAAVLSDMDADIATLEAKLAKARAIKLGMMQELLTGRIRLVTTQSEGVL